ncbi:Zn-ribbon domain-containing OB-fold protein [Pseudonocardia parietis]|uniref:OB-fold protein n=1 Tax=Pseudonocardia parietis TaxID=570936 RepID=A0ABS4VQM1_9PSEU|nr:OB-fold domain-containing protein [Pseudonocardia parietis]MBP2366214.1 putative OB-fold protein [Pseudonocardia parietis]
MSDAAELTAGFWAAAAARELVRPVCRDCGRSFFTPQIACPGCLSENWVYERSSGRGTVYSSTVVHKAASPGVAVPFGLGIVDLEEGWSMLTTLLGDRLPAIGDPVEVAWVERAGRLQPAFAAAVPA